MRLLLGSGIEPPRFGDALEGLLAAVNEAHRRSDDGRLHGGTHENSAWRGGGLDARRDVDSHAGERVAGNLALASVHTGADLQAEWSYRPLDRARCFDCLGGRVEAS